MNNTAPKVYFLIPAFNESENLPYLFSNLRRISAYLERDYQVIVVNDCSNDNTAEVVERHAEKQPITLINFEENRGPGAAFEAAFREALRQSESDDILVTIEADNTSDLCILGRMLEQINRGADVALASVYGAGKVVGAPLIRRLLSFFANLLMKITLGMPKINTFSSFFRMYRRSVIEKLFAQYQSQVISEPGFVCMVELLIKFKHLGVNIVETPMLLDSNIRVGDSKMKILRTIVSYLRVLKYHLFSGKYKPGAPASAAREFTPNG